MRRGDLPENPYLVIGQQSLVDPSRAPPGCHTLWAYSRVPPAMPGGWPRYRDPFADRIEARIEGLRTGFRGLILGRSVQAPPDLDAMDENLVGGDLGGGSISSASSSSFGRSSRTSVIGRRCARRLPGVGVGSPRRRVHGACGYNAAQMALADESSGGG